MHFFYILHSKHLDKYYIGETSDVNHRLKLHHNKTFNNSFTSKANDWELIISYKTINKQNAIFLENFIKRMKSKKFILKIIDNPKILDDILSKK